VKPPHGYPQVNRRGDSEMVLIVFCPFVVGHGEGSYRKYFEIDSFADPGFGVVSNQNQLVEFSKHFQELKLVESLRIKDCALVRIFQVIKSLSRDLLFRNCRLFNLSRLAFFLIFGFGQLFRAQLNCLHNLF
jgi:hypothetical protein